MKCVVYVGVCMEKCSVFISSDKGCLRVAATLCVYEHNIHCLSGYNLNFKPHIRGWLERVQSNILAEARNFWFCCANSRAHRIFRGARLFPIAKIISLIKYRRAIMELVKSWMKLYCRNCVISWPLWVNIRRPSAFLSEAHHIPSPSFFPGERN